MVRVIRSRTGGIHQPLAADSIVRLWALRILVPLGGHYQFLARGYGRFSDDGLARAIGLEHLLEQPGDGIDSKVDGKAILAELRAMHRQAEKQAAKASVPAGLRQNIGRLTDLVGLSQTDSRILESAILVHSEPMLDKAAQTLGELTSVKMFQVLAAILGLPEPDVRAALSAQGILARSGLVSVERRTTQSLQNKLDLLSDQFADLMVVSEADPVSLLCNRVSLASPAQLKLADYGHIQRDLDFLRPYLQQAVATGRRGVNIYLHGAPGTGKSQLARALAADLQAELFEVATEDEDGDPITGERRLNAFRAAQSFFTQRRALLAFDEAEDVFSGGRGLMGLFSLLGGKSAAQSNKGWLNRMLEENAVPTIWLSNSIDGLDPAFMRRFDMVIELPVPPQKQRERIVRESCGDLLDAASIARIAEAPTLAPAVVARASAVVGSIREQLGAAQSMAAVERLINNTLQAQGHHPIVRNDPNRLPEVYDPCFIHADADLAAVAAGLVKSRSGRLCLYGPPGTGKTAYGRWLAQRLDVPLLVKRASDLISMWVGGTEKNIASAFREAEQDGALLLIDEVDSFLQDRRGAQRSWEVTEVNEMLTQMEAFPGVFIASTNLMQGLDQAALRRFDLKVKFDFLHPDQAWELLQRYCAQIQLPVSEPGLRPRVMRMQRLTPGDFAAVLRQSRFRPLESAAMLVSALEAECAVKEGAKASIGFI